MEDLVGLLVEQLNNLNESYNQFKENIDKLNEIKENLIARVEESRRQFGDKSLIQQSESIHDDVINNEQAIETSNLNEEAKEKILYLAKLDDSSNEENEIVIRDDLKTDFLKEKYNLKDCEVILEAVDLEAFERTEKLRKNKNTKEKEEIENLCDIDGFLERLLNENSKTTYNRKKSKKRKLDDLIDEMLFGDDEDDGDENENKNDTDTSN